MSSILFISYSNFWWFTITNCGFSCHTFWICNNDCMTSVSIITNRCGWSTSINTVTTILNNKLILRSVWVSDCYSVASIWIFCCSCCCSFTVFTIFDDSVGNITVSIRNFNSVSSIVVISHFNFWSLTIFTILNNCFFSYSIWICYSDCVASIWIFCCSDIGSFTVFTIFNFSCWFRTIRVSNSNRVCSISIVRYIYNWWFTVCSISSVFTFFTFFAFVAFFTGYSLRSTDITNLVPRTIFFLINITCIGVDISITVFTIISSWGSNST